MAADMQEGWETVYIVKDCHHYFELVNDRFPDGGMMLNITGDGPTPQKHATEDLGLMAEIISCFARTDEPRPACTWEHSIH